MQDHRRQSGRHTLDVLSQYVVYWMQQIWLLVVNAVTQALSWVYVLVL